MDRYGTDLPAILPTVPLGAALGRAVLAGISAGVGLYATGRLINVDAVQTALHVGLALCGVLAFRRLIIDEAWEIRLRIELWRTKQQLSLVNAAIARLEAERDTLLSTVATLPSDPIETATALSKRLLNVGGTMSRQSAMDAGMSRREWGVASHVIRLANNSGLSIDDYMAQFADRPTTFVMPWDMG